MKQALFAIVSAALVAGSATAQDYPAKPVRLIVSQSPGTPGDLAARVVASEMPKFLGQSMLVENKPSAGSLVAYEYVAKQVAPDGYTLLLALVPDLAILPLTVKNLRFDPLKDLPPVISLIEGRIIFGSPAKVPWKTLNEMVAYAKANPGKLNYASASSLTRILAEALVRKLGLTVTHVPYASGAAQVNGVLAGEVQMGFLGEAAAIAAGDRLRPLAATGQQRAAQFLDVPTFAELGHPEVKGTAYSLNLPLGVPKPVLDKLHAAASRMLRDPEAKAKFAKIQFEVVEIGPEAAAKRLAEEGRFFAEVAKKAGIQPQ